MRSGQGWSCMRLPLIPSHVSGAYVSDASLCVTRTKYTDPNGVERDWESAQRQTRPKDSDIDGVGIVAILEKPSGSSYPHAPLCTRL